MDIKDLKFDDAEFIGQDVTSLPDSPSREGISAAELKARLDNVPKMMIALGKHNRLIDALQSPDGAKNIGAAEISGVGGTDVQGVLEGMVPKSDIAQIRGRSEKLVMSQRAVTDAIDAGGGSGGGGEVEPIGCIKVFAGELLPEGYLWCDGTSYPANGVYRNLYDVIGMRYNQPGDAAGTFRVPVKNDGEERCVIKFDKSYETKGVTAPPCVWEIAQSDWKAMEGGGYMLRIPENEHRRGEYCVLTALYDTSEATKMKAVPPEMEKDAAGNITLYSDSAFPAKAYIDRIYMVAAGRVLSVNGQWPDIDGEVRFTAAQTPSNKMGFVTATNVQDALSQLYNPLEVNRSNLVATNGILSATDNTVMVRSNRLIIVYISCESSSTAASALNLYQSLPGYRPGGERWGVLTNRTKGTVQPAQITTSGYINIRGGVTPNDQICGTLMWTI